MKRSSLFACIMIPTLIALLLLPPLSCGIFQQTALHSAQQEAAQSLEALEQSILPLMEHYFEDGTRTGQGTVRAFLRRISTAARGAKGNAQVFILASEQQVIYPYDEEERREVSTFAAQCLQYLPEDGQTKTAEITDENGEAVTELTDGTLYELRVTVADNGALDRSAAEREISISVALGK